jgi:hypothetical protein
MKESPRHETCSRVVLALLALLIIVVLLVALLVVQIQDYDGWGTFMVDVAKASAVQLVAALVLLAVMLAVLQVRGQDSGKPPSSSAVWAAFVLAPVLVLPVLPVVFQRPIDVYDGIQTLALLAIFCWLGSYYRENLWKRSPRPEPESAYAPGPQDREPKPEYTPVPQDRERRKSRAPFQELVG